MRFLKEKEIRHLKSREDLQEAIDFYEEHDTWLQPIANEIMTFGVTDYPLFNQDLQAKIQDTCPKECFDECVSDAGIFLTLPYGNKYVTFATRDISLNSIYERSGSNCRMVRTIDSHGYIKALSAEERGEIINKGWRTSTEKIKVLISDEKISFVGSSKYVILSYRDGIAAAEKILGNDFEIMEYVKGYISHEYIVAEWQIKSPETESHRLMLENFGFIGEYEEVKYIFRFSSSNIGNAKMSGRLFLCINGSHIPIGKAQSIWHLINKKVDDKSKLNDDNGCKIKDFECKLGHMGAVLKENEDVIELMGNTMIDHPSPCLKKMLEFCPSIPEKSKEYLTDNFHLEECTAMDIYLEISSLLEDITDLGRLVQASEEVAQLQFKNFKEYDKL